MTDHVRPFPQHSASANQPYMARHITSHRNELDTRILRILLDRLQRKLYARRGTRTTLVVHGGVISVLGRLEYRKSTTDIDFIARTLPEELGNSASGKLGFMSLFRKAVGAGISQDVRAILKECISETADDFNAKNARLEGLHLEQDWMNADADVAIPWTLSPENYRVETLVEAAMANAKEENVIYDSAGLRLLAIPPSWTFALKLQRFNYSDEEDLIYLLQLDNELRNNGEETFVNIFEARLKRDCPQMEYGKFPERALQEWRIRVRDCVKKAKFLLSTPQPMLQGH